MNESTVVYSIHCNHDCPYWGVQHDDIWEVGCDCGREEIACGHCMRAGRITACLKCSKQGPQTHGTA